MSRIDFLIHGQDILFIFPLVIESIHQFAGKKDTISTDFLVLDDFLYIRCFGFPRVKGDTVILAVGLASQKQLAQELEGKVNNLHVIGHCVEPQRIAQAIEGAFRVAREI